MSFRSVLQEGASLAENTISASEVWKEQHPGAKLIACFPVYTPFPLIEATGALPVRLFGAGTTLEIDHADSRIRSFVCSIASVPPGAWPKNRRCAGGSSFFHCYAKRWTAETRWNRRANHFYRGSFA